jgi:glycerate dehydrogenase
MDHPFTTLPNVIASPHNSASVPAYRLSALRNATTNCRRAILGEPIRYLAGPDERLL